MVIWVFDTVSPQIMIRKFIFFQRALHIFVIEPFYYQNFRNQTQTNWFSNKLCLIVYIFKCMCLICHHLYLGIKLCSKLLILVTKCDYSFNGRCHHILHEKQGFFCVNLWIHLQPPPFKTNC